MLKRQNVAKMSHSNNGVTVPSPPTFYSSAVCNCHIILLCFRPEVSFWSGITVICYGIYMHNTVLTEKHANACGIRRNPQLPISLDLVIVAQRKNCPYPYFPSKLGTTVPSDSPYSGHVVSKF